MTATDHATPLRVLFVLPGLGSGGQERQLTELAIGLVGRGHHVDVAVGYSGGHYEPILQAAGVGVIVLRAQARTTYHVPFRERVVEAVHRLRALRRLVTRGRYDIVHGYGDSSNVYISMTDGFRRRHRLVWGVRASERTAANLLTDRLLPLLSRRVSTVICNSNAGAGYVRSLGCRPQAIDVIPNGIDTVRCDIDPVARRDIREQLGIGDHEALVGIVGNFHPRKGIPIFLEAASKFDATLSARFIVLGGDYFGNREELDATVTRLGITDRVMFHPVVPDAERYMNAFDVLVSASYTEGFSNVIAEAMACGTPCVATDVGDSAMIVGDLGKIVPPGDADALAEALAAIIGGDRVDGEQLRAAITGSYSIPLLVERSEAVFRRVLR